MHALFHWLASLRRLFHGPPLTGPRLVVPLPPFVAGHGARIEIGMQRGGPALRLAVSTHRDAFADAFADPFPGPYADAFPDDRYASRRDDPYSAHPLSGARLGSGRPAAPCFYDDTEDDGLPF